MRNAPASADLRDCIRYWHADWPGADRTEGMRPIVHDTDLVTEPDRTWQSCGWLYEKSPGRFYKRAWYTSQRTYVDFANSLI